MADAAAPNMRLSGWRLARFSAIAIPLYALALPVTAYLPAILAKDFGIALGWIGLLMLVGQVVNSLLDPVIGALSDRTGGRFGRRRPWIAVGGIVFTLGSVMLFFPPERIGLVWLASGLLMYFIGASAVGIPLMAWSGEISDDYHERTRISGYFTLLASAALVLTLLLPAVADQLRPGDGRLRLNLFGALVLLTALPGLWLTLTAAPDHPRPLRHNRFRLGETMGAIFGNPLLLRVLVADAAVRAGQGIRTSLMLFIVTAYFQRPEWAAGMFLFQYSFGTLAAPIWQRIGMRLGKGRTAVLAELSQAAINFGLLLLSPDRFWLMLLLALAQGLTQGSGNLMLRAMVADIGDQHRAATGQDRVGLYYSVFSISEKLGGALAVGLALPLVAALGFDAKAAANPPAALDALLLVFALGPALAHALAAALVARFPITAERHLEIRRDLDRRDAAMLPAE